MNKSTRRGRKTASKASIQSAPNVALDEVDLIEANTALLGHKEALLETLKRLDQTSRTTIEHRMAHEIHRSLLGHMDVLKAAFLLLSPSMKREMLERWSVSDCESVAAG